MRVLIVTESLIGETSGGAVAQLVDAEAKHLASTGSEVTILARSSRLSVRMGQASANVRTVRFLGMPFNSRWRALSPLLSLLSAGITYRFRLRQGGFDVIHYHNVFAASGVEWLGRPAPETARVLTEHAPRGAEYELYRRVPPLFRRVIVKLADCVELHMLRRMDLVIFLSAFMQREASQRFERWSGRCEIIPPGVDTGRFVPRDAWKARTKLRLPVHAPLVVTVRRLQHRMGLEMLVDAAAILRQRGFVCHTVIVGAGPLARPLTARIEELGLSETVRLVGYVPDSILPLYYQAADAVVVPTAALEGFGLVLLEALSCDRPVVATPVGAMPEVLREVDGSLVLKESSPEAIAAGMVRAVALSRDGRWRAAVVDRYTWSAFGASHEKALRRAAAFRTNTLPVRHGA